MSQKELNYLEDAFNHEVLITTMLSYLTGEELTKQIEKHKTNQKKLLNLLEGELDA